MRPVLLALLLGAAAASASSRTPPMGFNSWNHFGMHPTTDLLLGVAEAFEQTGLKDAGYTYINTDDGWLQLNRTADGELQPMAAQFPGGIAALADALHSKGFRFGIYGAAGQTTCGSRAGSLYHERRDAATLAAWGVDYLKYDLCGQANLQPYAHYYPMRDALQATGRDVYLSFEPFFSLSFRFPITWAAYLGDSWRTAGDIRPKWSSILGNARSTNRWAGVARPGHFNDADVSSC